MALRVLLIAASAMLAGQGCVGQAIETTTDAVIAVGKIDLKLANRRP